MLGDLYGFGLGYFDFDETRGYVRTATEVSSDNSALMRNIRRHENALEGAITGIARAVMCVSRGFGEDEKTAKARARGLANKLSADSLSQ